MLWIPATILNALVLAALYGIVRDVAAGRAAGGGGETSERRGNLPALLAEVNRFASAESYVSELHDLLLDEHPSLEGVTSEQFGARALAALRRVADEEPELLRRADVDVTALARAFEWDALCGSWLPAGVGDADPRIDARIDLLATALIEAVGDPFTRLVRGDHFFNLSKVLDSQFPSETGLFLDRDADGVYVRAVLRDSDASDKGLRAGDRVLAIDGRPVDDRPLRALEDEVARPCRLRFARAGFDAPVELPLASLDPLRLGVRACRLDGDVGYVSFSMFGGQAFGGVFFETRRLVRDGARALILDLRGNPGGLIAEAVSIANLFLPPELVVTHIEARVDSPDLPAEFESGQPAFGPDLPLVLLIDRSSASASELVTGALRDHRRALLVGERTFGKGIGQRMQPLLLTRGAGAARQGFPRVDLLWLTALRFLPPREVDFHGVGLDPDVVAPRPPDSRARLVERAHLIDDRRLFDETVELTLADDEVAALRRPGPAPAPLLAAAARCDVVPRGDEEREALKDFARRVLSSRHPRLIACPDLDPALQRAVAAAALALRRKPPK